MEFNFFNFMNQPQKEIDAEERVRVKEIDYEIQFNPKTDDVKTMR